MSAAAQQVDDASVLGEGSANCGDDLQPGLSATYRIKFIAPPNAKPMSLRLWGEYDSVDLAHHPAARARRAPVGCAA